MAEDVPVGYICPPEERWHMFTTERLASIVADLNLSENRFHVCGEKEYTEKFVREYQDRINITSHLVLGDEESYQILDDAIECSDPKDRFIITEKRTKALEKADALIGKRVCSYQAKLFEMIYGAYRLNRKIVNYSEITITERCTLNCKNCSLFMPYYQNPKHSLFDFVSEDIDTFFGKIDYTFHFRLLGGEPFLHPDFKAILQKICAQYRDKIGYFDIATNGTMIPDDEILDLCRQYRVAIAISDYNLNASYEAKVDNLVGLIEQNGVACERNRFENWFELGFPIDTANQISEEETRELFQICNTEWRSFYAGKLYFCSVCASAQRGELIEGWDSDSFDFTQEVDPVSLLQFNLGMNANGRNSLCGRCKGYRSHANRKQVRAAIQISKKEATELIWKK